MPYRRVPRRARCGHPACPDRCQYAVTPTDGPPLTYRLCGAHTTAMLELGASCRRINPSELGWLHLWRARRRTRRTAAA